MSEEKMREAFDKWCAEELKGGCFWKDAAWGAWQAALRTHENESEAGAEPIYQVYEGPTQTWMDATLNYYNSAMADGSRCRIVYLTPPPAQAIETAAIMKCAELMVKRGVLSTDGLNYEALLALIPQDGRTKLEEFGMRVAEEVRLQMFSRYQDDKDPYISMEALVSIVTNLINGSGK